MEGADRDASTGEGVKRRRCKHSRTKWIGWYENNRRVYQCGVCLKVFVKPRRRKRT
jgi:hypothetical protein